MYRPVQVRKECSLHVGSSVAADPCALSAAVRMICGSTGRGRASFVGW
jgi:hypothetical protein